MKRSLRIRFTLIFTGLTAAILIGIWCVNNWMLESFYVQDKVQTLELAYEQMNIMVMDCLDEGKAIADEFAGSDKLDSGEQTDAVRLLKTLNDKYNIMTVIVDGINDKVIVSSARDAGFMIDKAKKYIIGNDDRRAQIIKQDNNFTIQKTFEPHSRSFYLECWGYYSDNNTIFIMTTPLASIRESVELSNRFLAYVGIAALILGSVIIYFVSKTVTSPIMKLSEIAKRMSKLDFEAKYQGKAHNEIDLLGENINKLSDSLEKTISELKTANNELQRDVEKKEAIDEMRKEFLANVSHELKTPIALIQGYAEGLQEEINDDPESRQFYCDVIVDEAAKMNNMVKKLLTLNQLEFGEDDVQFERFDITSLISGVLQSLDILIEQKEAQVIFRHKNPVYVWADEFKVEQVVRNYVNNALNHVDGEKVIEIKITKENDMAKITVFNTGTPIPEEDLGRIWDKFYKVDKARTREYGGSGVGLSIVKAIMESMHQRYGVINYDNGVEFWFELDDKNEV